MMRIKELAATYSILTLLALLSALAAPAQACDAVVLQEKHPIFADLKIPTYVWEEPGTKPQAIVVGLHGGCLHGTSYGALAHSLAEQNCMFVSFDMRGYGKWHHANFGEEFDKTFNYKNSLADVKEILTRLHQRYPGVPVYCLGESLGANFCGVVAGTIPELTDGIIMVNPFAGPRLFFSPLMLRSAAQILMHPRSPLDVSPYLKRRLAYHREDALLHVIDPLNRNKQTLKELGQSLMINLKGRKMLKELNPDMPVLVLVAEKDKLCSPHATRRLFNKIPAVNKRLVKLANSGHLVVESSALNQSAQAAMTNWFSELDTTKTATRSQPERATTPRHEQHQSKGRS